MGFVIKTREVYSRGYYVEAESKEEAIAKLESGNEDGVTPIEWESEYLYTMDSSNWHVSESSMPWKRIVRASGLVEWVCIHGVGHPDLESAAKIAEATGESISIVTTHGCDGCCSRDDFPGKGGKRCE